MIKLKSIFHLNLYTTFNLLFIVIFIFQNNLQQTIIFNFGLL
jgi:hypothetical protein